MIKKLRRHSREIAYLVRKSKRAKNIKISISFDRGIIATLPFGVNQRHLEKFLYKHFDWLEKRVDDFKKIDKSKLIKTGPNDYLRKKKEAHILVRGKLELFNKFYGFEYKKFCIRNQKTRWGSCSSGRNLNFNYKLVYLSEALAEYVVVHELCHLKEMNHSKKFWALVEKLVPDYKEKRKRLKEESKYFI